VSLIVFLCSLMWIDIIHIGVIRAVNDTYKPTQNNFVRMLDHTPIRGNLSFFGFAMSYTRTKSEVSSFSVLKMEGVPMSTGKIAIVHAQYNIICIFGVKSDLTFAFHFTNSPHHALLWGQPVVVCRSLGDIIICAKFQIILFKITCLQVCENWPSPLTSHVAITTL